MGFDICSTNLYAIVEITKFGKVTKASVCLLTRLFFFVPFDYFFHVRFLCDDPAFRDQIGGERFLFDFFFCRPFFNDFYPF